MPIPYLALSILAVVIPIILIIIKILSKAKPTHPFGNQIAFYGLNFFLVLSMFGLMLLETGLWVYDDWFVVIGLIYLISGFVFLRIKKQTKSEKEELAIFLWASRLLTIVFILVLFTTIPQIVSVFFTNGSGYYKIGYFNQNTTNKTPFTEVTAYRPKFSFEYRNIDNNSDKITLSLSTPSLPQSSAVLSSPHIHISYIGNLKKGVYDLSTFDSYLSIFRSDWSFRAKKLQGKLYVDKIKGDYISGKIQFLAFGKKSIHFGDKVKAFLTFNNVKIIEKP